MYTWCRLNVQSRPIQLILPIDDDTWLQVKADWQPWLEIDDNDEEHALSVTVASSIGRSWTNALSKCFKYTGQQQLRRLDLSAVGQAVPHSSPLDYCSPKSLVDRDFAFDGHKLFISLVVHHTAQAESLCVLKEARCHPSHSRLYIAKPEVGECTLSTTFPSRTCSRPQIHDLTPTRDVYTSTKDSIPLETASVGVGRIVAASSRFRRLPSCISSTSSNASKFRVRESSMGQW